jgi:hypothetical protein
MIVTAAPWVRVAAREPLALRKQIFALMAEASVIP